MRPLRFAILGGFLAALTACAAAPPAQPPGQSAPQTQKSTVGLEARLLTVADLPPGYSVTTLPDLGTGTRTEGCPALDAAQAKPGATPADVAFTDGVPGRLLSQVLQEMAEQDSRRALDELAATPRECGRFSAETMGIKVDFTTTVAEFPQLGKQTVAIRLSASAGSLGASILDEYLIAVRDDRLLMLIVATSPGQVDRPLLESLVRKAWTKATA